MNRSRNFYIYQLFVLIIFLVIFNSSITYAQSIPTSRTWYAQRWSDLIEPWLQLGNSPIEVVLEASIWQKNLASGYRGGIGVPTVEQMEERCHEQELAVQSTPEDAAVYFRRGDCYAQDLTLQRTLDNYDWGLQLDATNARAYKDRAAFRYSRNNKIGALADLSMALMLSPEPIAYMERGELYYDLGSANCLHDFNEALRLVVGDAKLTKQITQMRASAWISYGDYQKAQEDFTTLMQTAGSDRGSVAWAQEERGSVRFRLKDYEGAIEDFSSALSAGASAYGYTHYGLAVSYYKLQQFQRALTEINAAITDVNSNYQYSEYFLTRASILIKLKKIMQSEEDLNRVIQFTTEMIHGCTDCKWLSPYYKERGIAFAILGQKSKSLSDLDLAKRLEEIDKVKEMLTKSLKAVEQYVP